MLNGVDIYGWPRGGVSCKHTEQDLERITEAVREAIVMLKADQTLCYSW